MLACFKDSVFKIMSPLKLRLLLLELILAYQLIKPELNRLRLDDGQIYDQALQATQSNLDKVSAMFNQIYRSNDEE